MRKCKRSKLNFPKYLFGTSGDKFVAKLEVFSKLIEDGRTFEDVSLQNPSYQNRLMIGVGLYKSYADICLPEISITLTALVMHAVQLYIFICHNNTLQDIIFSLKLYSLMGPFHIILFSSREVICQLFVIGKSYLLLVNATQLRSKARHRESR